MRSVPYKYYFRWVTSAYSSKAIVFLGDLIDEGSEAGKDVYHEYATRFLQIYPPVTYLQTIYIPGDNDIGGEGADIVTLEKINRFQEMFGPNKPVYRVSSYLDLAPVSRLTQHGVYNLTFKQEHLSNTRLVVAVSHLPVLPLDGRFAEQVMELVRPNAIFSAHNHHGFHYSLDRNTF